MYWQRQFLFGVVPGRVELPTSTLSVKARQQTLLRENGGREAVIARGDLGFTPVPGSALAFD